MKNLSRFLLVFVFVASESWAQHISFLRAERISPNSLSSRVSVPFHSGVVVIDLPQNALRLPNYENQRRPRRMKSETSPQHKPSFNFLSSSFMTGNNNIQTPWTPVTSESRLYRPRKSEKIEWPSEFNDISAPYGDPSDQYTLFVPAAAQTSRINSINEQLPSYKPRSSQPLPPAPVHNRRSNQKPQMMIPFSMPVSSMKPASQSNRKPGPQVNRNKPAHPSSAVTGHSAGMSFEDMRLQELAPLFVPIESGPTGPRMQNQMKGRSEDLIPQDLLEQIISEIIPKIEAEERSRRKQNQEAESAQGQSRMKQFSPKSRPQLSQPSSNDEGFPYLMNSNDGFDEPSDLVPKPKPFPRFKTNVQTLKMSKTNVPQPPIPQPPSKTSPVKGYSPPAVQQQEQAPRPQSKGYQPEPPRPQTKSPPPQPRKGFTPMTPRPYSAPPPPTATKGGNPSPPVKGSPPPPLVKGAPPPPPPVKGIQPIPLPPKIPPPSKTPPAPAKGYPQPPSKSPPPPPPVQQSYQEAEPQQPEQQSYQEPELQQPIQQSYQEPGPQKPVQQEQSYQEPQQEYQELQQEYQEPQIEQQKEDQVPEEPQQQEVYVPERKGRPPPAPKSRPPPPSPPAKGQRVEPAPQVMQEEYPTKSEPKQQQEARKVPDVPPPPRKGNQSRKPQPRKPSPRPFLKPPPPTKAQPAPEERKRSRVVVTTPSTTTILYDDSATYTAPEVTTESSFSYTDVGFDDDAASDEFRESDMPSKMPLDDGEDSETPVSRLTSNSLREELKPRTVEPLRILPLSPANRARSSTPTRSASLRLATNNDNYDEDEDDDEDDLLNDNRTPLSDATESPDNVATTFSSLTIRPNSFLRARVQNGEGSKRFNSNLMFGDRLRSNNNNNNNVNRNVNEDNYDEVDDESEELNENASNLSRKRRFEEFDSWEDDTSKDDDQLDTGSSDKSRSVSPTPSTTPPTSTVPITTIKEEITTTTETYELPLSHHETRFRRFIAKPGRKIRLLDGSLNLEQITS